MKTLETGETTINTVPVTNARNHCHNRCKSASVENTFSALRRVSEGSFKCKCFGHSFDSVVTEVNAFKCKIIRK